jgi:hypothetical protein
MVSGVSAFTDIRMGSPRAIGQQDGLVRVDIPLEPAPPDDWIRIFNSNRHASVRLPVSWNRPIAHRSTVRLTARLEKLMEYLGHVKQMIQATSVVYGGGQITAVPQPTERVQMGTRRPAGARPNLQEIQRMLDEFDPS